MRHIPGLSAGQLFEVDRREAAEEVLSRPENFRRHEKPQLVDQTRGQILAHDVVAGRELEIEAEFLQALDQRAIGSDWLFNGPGTPDRPGDLAYWVGYRIARAYYANTDDKQAAVRDIIEMSDPHDFLARSGWRPGVAVE